MAFAYTPYALPLILSAVLSGLFALYAWRHRSRRGIPAFVLIAVSVAVWSCGYTLELTAVSLEAKLLWGQLQYVGIALVPYAFLLFAVTYMNMADQRPWSYLPYLSIVPTITILLAFTNGAHGLIWQETAVAAYPSFTALQVSYGGWFWVHFASSYLFLAAASVILVRGAWRMSGLYRAQVTAVVIAALVPWISNILFFTGLTPIPGLDLTPFAFTITVAALAGAIFSYRLVDAAPVARGLIIEQMRDGIIVLNQSGRIVDINGSAAGVIGLSQQQVLGQTAVDILTPWPHLVERLHHHEDGLTTLRTGRGITARRYTVRITLLRNDQNRPLGRLLTILPETPDTDMPSAGEDTPSVPVTPPPTPTSPSPPPTDDSAWPAWVQAVVAFFLPPPREEVERAGGSGLRLSQLLERAFTAMLRFAALFAALALLVSAPTLWAAGNETVALIFIGCTGAIGLLGLVRAVNFNYRIYAFLTALYIIATAELVAYGYSIEAFIFFMTLTAVGIVLQGFRRGMGIALFSWFTMGVVGWAIATGRFHPVGVFVGAPIAPTSVNATVTQLLVLAACGGIIITVIGTLIQSLDRAWEQETQARNLLRRERDLLETRVAERTVQLSQSETNLRTVINSTPAVILQINAADEIVFGRVPGLAETEMETRVLGRSLFDFVHADDHTAVRNAVVAGRGDDQEHQVEFAAHLPGDETADTYLASLAPLQTRAADPDLLLICTDITARKKAEQKQQALLDELTRITTQQQIILDNTAAAIMMQKGRRIVWANPATEQLVGYTQEEMRRQTNINYHVSSEAYAAFGRATRAAMEKGRVYRGELQIRHRDGRLLWAYITGQAINPQRIREDGVLWIMHDITDLKKTQLALEHTAEQLSEAQKIGRMGNWELDLSTTQLTWSDTHYQLWGLAPDADARPLNLLEQSLHEEDVALAKSVWQRAKEGLPFDAEYRIALPDGDTRYMHTRAELVRDDTGTAVRLAGLTQDITERKKAENITQAFQNHLKGVQHVGAALARVGELNDFYRQAIIYGREQLGFDRLGLLLVEDEVRIQGTYGTDMDGNLRDERHIRRRLEQLPWLDALRDQHGRLRTEPKTWPRVPIYEGDEVRGYGWRITAPLVDDKGHVIAHLLTDNYVSQRKTRPYEMELLALYATTINYLLSLKNRSAELEEAKNAADKANVAKSRFLAGMSHELRTPLNAILGFTELLSAADLKPQEQEYLSTVNRSGEHLLALINDVLDISKIEAGKMELKTAPTYVQPMLSQAVDMYRARANERRLTYELHIGREVPEQIMIDKVKLRQIVLNLVSNAIKFTREGKVTVHAGWRDGQLQLKVSDTGVGISSEDQEKLFRPFTQVGQAEENSTPGTGLGLNLVYEYVQLMNGRLNLASAPGSGTTFSLHLPAPAVEAPAVPTLQPAGRKRRILEANLPDGRIPLILIVDDIVHNRTLVKAILKRIGCRSETAVNGREAIEKTAAVQPDLVLMDLLMPEMDGYTAADHIRIDHPELPILAFTASAYSDNDEKSRAAGFNGLVRKPITAGGLQEILQAHLDLTFVHEADDLPAVEEQTKTAVDSDPYRLPDTADHLPSSLLDQLQQATDTLDITAAEEIVGQISDHDDRLAAALHHRINAFELDAINHWLQTLTSKKRK